LAVGKLHRAHGLHGELIMEVLTDFPERLVPGKQVYSGVEHTPRLIRSVRAQNRGILITFEGFDSPETAGELRNQIVYVRSDELPELPEGSYYQYQLIGLSVVNHHGNVLGQLVEILETGANEVYVVKSEDGVEQLLPATNEVITNIDLIQRIIQVKPPEWE
jgi:16S rRNA processing protein RimM